MFVNGVSQLVHFVVDERSHREFFRDALDVERIDEVGMAVHAPHAFPDLFFLPDVWGGLGHFQGGYARVRESLHRFLAVLDDHGAWVFCDSTGRLTREEADPKGKIARPVTNQLIEQRFKRWGFEIAPEKPNVRADGYCRRARERTLNGRVLYCDWHYKFERHINRAHIHPPVAESSGRVIIAIFRDHLPLPGD